MSYLRGRGGYPSQQFSSSTAYTTYYIQHTHTRRYLRDLKRIEAENDPNDHLNIASNDAEAQKRSFDIVLPSPRRTRSSISSKEYHPQETAEATHHNGLQKIFVKLISPIFFS